jgi:ribonuclease P protein component
MNSFAKIERLNKRKLINQLFSSESKSFNLNPLRIVYLPHPTDEVTSVLISVSKRHFKRAVKRNRVKRQIREAYRNHKDMLSKDGGEKHWLIAFIYLSDELVASETIDACMKLALTRIAEN